MDWTDWDLNTDRKNNLFSSPKRPASSAVHPAPYSIFTAFLSKG